MSMSGIICKLVGMIVISALAYSRVCPSPGHLSLQALQRKPLTARGVL